MTVKKSLKYNINREIGFLPRKWTIKRIKGILKIQHGISGSTFDRDRNIEIDEETFIPSNRLDTYAVILGVDQDKLKNYHVKGKPLSEIDPDDEEFAIGLRKKVGLS